MPAFTAKGSELRDAAAWAVRLCPARNARPILQGILIEPGDGQITLSAYDLETAGSITFPADVQATGRAVVSGRLLSAISKTFTAKSHVEFSECDGQCEIAVGRNRWTLPTLPLHEFPDLPPLSASAVKLDAQTLRRALERVLPAADRSPFGRLAATMKLEIAGQRAKLIATDGYRMALAEIDAEPVDTASPIDVQLPTTFAEAMMHALPSSVAAAEFGAVSGVVTLATPSTRLSGRQGAAEWPAWERFVPPPEQDVSAIFVVADLATAVDRVLAVADPDKPIRISLSEDGITLDAVADRGTVSAEASVSEYTGAPKESAIKPAFLNAALGTLGSDLAIVRSMEKVTAKFDFAAIDDETGLPVEDFRHFVMPMDPKKLRTE